MVAIVFFFFNVGNLIIWSYKYFLHDFAVSIIYYLIVKKNIIYCYRGISCWCPLHLYKIVCNLKQSGYSGFLLHNFSPFLVFVLLSDAYIPQRNGKFCVVCDSQFTIPYFFLAPATQHQSNKGAIKCSAVRHALPLYAVIVKDWYQG